MTQAAGIGFVAAAPALGLRVLHCIATMQGGGAERQLGYLCGGLAELGCDVTVALMDGGINFEGLTKTGARVVMIPRTSSYEPAIVLRLLHVLRDLRPQVVQTWLPMMNVAGGIAAMLARRIWVASVRIAQPPRVWQYRLEKAFVSRLPAAVVANSLTGRTWVTGQARARRVPPVYVVPNAIPLDDIDRTARSRREMIFDQDAELILFAGRFDPQKNVRLLLQALALVLSVRPRAIGVLCGTGPLLAQCMSWVNGRDLRGRIYFPGYVADVWQWMKSANVFVSVSVYEGRPNVVLEAMACGCPVVVSDIAEHREFLDESCAVLVRVNSPADIARGIVGVLGDRPLAAARAAKARSRVSQYTVDAMARAYHDIYLGLISSDARARGLTPPNGAGGHGRSPSHP